MVGRNKMPITFRGQRVKGLPEMNLKKGKKRERFPSKLLSFDNDLFFSSVTECKNT